MRSFVLLSCLATLLLSSSLIAEAQTAHAGESIAERSGLSEDFLDQVYPLFKFQGVSQTEAEALFGSAIAAIYYPDRAEVRLLASDELRSAKEWLVQKAIKPAMGRPAKSYPQESQLLSKLRSTSHLSLRDFLEPPVSGTSDGLEITHEPYLAKMPSVEKPTGRASARGLKKVSVDTSNKGYYYIYDDFENDVWTNWSRWDDTGGQYTWGINSCDSYSGSYSADAPRGGSQGALLNCSSPYPSSTKMYMYYQVCETIPDNWIAFLEMKFKASIDMEGEDKFSVYFEDSENWLWGWSFWGNWSQWYELVFNLRQWWHLGDLGSYYCNTLNLGFKSDSTSGNTGHGARVDDVYIFWGDTVGSHECKIVADPVSGTSPLTVAFRAITDMYSPEFRWKFGDDATSAERDPVHVYSRAGHFSTSLRVNDSYGTYCYASTAIDVVQGTCTYSISPSSGNFSASGGSGSFSVNTQSGCTWSANVSNAWIRITTGSAGNGSGTVSFSVDPNLTTSARIGNITIGTNKYVVNQSGSGVGCTPSPTVMCLNNNRFKVSATWETNQGDSGEARVVKLTNDTGYLWFFSESNVEAVLKVLNGCPINGNYWVFAGGLTNVWVQLIVEDTTTGHRWLRVNPQQTAFQPIQDTAAFSTCD